jgi:hypothetical protein
MWQGTDMSHCTLNNDRNKDKRAELMGLTLVAGKRGLYNRNAPDVLQ